MILETKEYYAMGGNAIVIVYHCDYEIKLQGYIFISIQGK